MSNETIAFNCKAQVKTIAVGREREDDDSYHSIVHVKLVGAVPGELLPKLLGALEVPDFWVKSTDGIIPAYPKLREIKSGATFGNVSAKIKTKKFTGARLGTISFKFDNDRQIAMTFKLSFPGLTDGGVGYLCQLFHDEIAVEVQSHQIDGFEGEDNG